MRRLPALLASLAAIALFAAVPGAGASAVTPHPDSVTVAPGGGTPGTSQNFALVGQYR